MAAISYLALFAVICNAFQVQHTGQVETVRESESGNKYLYLDMDMGMVMGKEEGVFHLRYIETGNFHGKVILKKRSFSSFRRRKARGRFKLVFVC